jgi:hypothetical protein
MRFQIAIACAVALLGCAASSSAQAVSLQFNNGRVTLNAQNAPIRTILTEWGRLGGTRIVNGDRVGGGPVTLELTDLPERQALDILLRSVAGYIVTGRQGAGVSTLGGVVILATSNAPRTQAPVTFGAATVQPQPRPLFEDARDADDRPGVAVSPVLQGPAVVRFPAPSPTPVFQIETPAPNSPRPVTTIQTLPGTSRPGEISPQPQQAPSAPGMPPPPQAERR